MKKILLIAAIASSMFAAGVSFNEEGVKTPEPSVKVNDEAIKPIQWWSYQQMVKGLQSKKITKPILLFVAQTTCGYCQSSLNEMAMDRRFIDFVEKNYTPVFVYQDKEQVDVTFASNYVPAFYILNPKNGKAMTPQPVKGAVSTADMQDYLERIKEAYDFYLQQNKK